MSLALEPAGFALAWIVFSLLIQREPAHHDELSSYRNGAQCVPPTTINEDTCTQTCLSSAAGLARSRLSPAPFPPTLTHEGKKKIADTGTNMLPVPHEPTSILHCFARWKILPSTGCAASLILPLSSSGSLVLILSMTYSTKMCQRKRMRTTMKRQGQLLLWARSISDGKGYQRSLKTITRP